MRNIRLCSLVLFCSFWLHPSSARAQEACTPVVYAFRHAEDETDRSALTRVGVEHAYLYPGMVDVFDDAHNYCPVGWVYSMYDFNPDRNPGTTNPFQTAEPLAYAACIARAIRPGVPLTGNPCDSPADFKPHMRLGNGHYLYEFLGTTSVTTAKPSATTQELRTELVSNASLDGFSSAIFWSSEGLHTLGAAIADGTNIPKKGGPTPPRNAVYVFKYSAGTGTFEVVDGTPFLQRYLQCFNVNPDGSFSDANYYCRPGDIPIMPDDSDDVATSVTALRGKICDTTTLGGQKQDGSFRDPCH